MKSPFIPIKKANIAIVNEDAPAEVFLSLERMGIRIVPAIKGKSLQPPVSRHPDMVITPLNLDTILAAPSVWDYYNRELGRFGIKVIKGNTEPKANYPYDIPYNAAILEDVLIHRLDKTDGFILDYAKKNNYALLNTKQGYTKCSLALLNGRSGITSDKGIAHVLNLKGYDILHIAPGYIELPGMDCGFIGGATGNISPSEMVITGNLYNHPDRERIESFINSKGIRLIYLSEKPVIDLGTIIGLYSEEM
ncbi:MAG: DUF6873 family GME fold protein [Bacillota bacterium]